MPQYDSFSFKAWAAMRSLPLLGGVLLFILIIHTSPDIVRSLNAYIVKSTPEENFGSYGWAMYSFIVPFCLAGVLRIKKNWPLIVSLLLTPIAYSISYWLWEFLGWVVMFLFLSGVYGAAAIFSKTKDTEDKEGDAIEIVAMVACIIYAIGRILGSLFLNSIMGFNDILFPCILGGYMVVMAIYDTFAFPEWNHTDEKVKKICFPSIFTNLYLVILLFVCIQMSDVHTSHTVAQSQSTRKNEISVFDSADTKRYKALREHASNLEAQKKYKDAIPFYQEAATIKHADENRRLANAMAYKADSTVKALSVSIPRKIKKIDKQKNMSAAFYKNEVIKVAEDIDLYYANGGSYANVEKYRYDLLKVAKQKKVKL